MPIYEYNCQHCQNEFDELIRGNEQVKCPQCGGTKIARKMSVCGFVSSPKFVGSAGSSCSGCAKGSCSGCSGVAR